MLATVATVTFSALVVLTCAGREVRDPPAQAPASPSASSPVATSASAAATSASAPIASPRSSASAPASAPAAAPAPAAHGPLPLPAFYGALEALARKDRRDHVRIGWLGDSHTAADIWSGEVRRRLQARYGDGGPGFVHLGWGAPHYRHEKAKLDPGKDFRHEPGKYAQAKRHDDGVLGLGGVRFVPREPGAHLSVEAGAAGETLLWDIAFRARKRDDQLKVKVAGAKALLPAESEQPSPVIRHRSFVAKGATSKLEVSAERGDPELFGVVAEGEVPGVVLDHLGLNGATIATALSWDEKAWVAELSRRKHDLVIVAYGTNESSAREPTAERYEGQLDALLGRVRSALPSAECLVVTPFDRAGAEPKARLRVITEGLSRAAKKRGCAIFDAAAVMGGPGGFEAWAAEANPRAASDGIHLTGKGYVALGDALASALLPRASGHAKSDGEGASAGTKSPLRW